MTMELVMPALRGSAARLWRPDGLRERYARYLATMHSVVRASVPLMARAVDRCAQSGVPSAQARALARHLAAHIEEERDHDAWLLEDLSAAGLDPGRELSRPPAPAVARLVGPQYYWVDCCHPACLLGYVAVLESNAPAPRLSELLAIRSGLPDDAFRTLRHHSEVDTGHSSAVFALLDRLDLSPVERRAVRVSALHTVSALIEVFDGLTTATGKDPT
jgi:hypothetical protein